MGDKAQENLVLIELKQWSTVEPSNLEDYVFVDGGDGPDDYWHPSYQALNYANIMRNFNVYVYEHKVGIEPCSYLHNMDKMNGQLLKDSRRYVAIDESPVFLKDDILKLREFVHKYVRTPDRRSNDLLYEIDNSEVRPSAEFGKMLNDAIEGNPFFGFDREQSFAVSKIVAEVNEAVKTGSRRAIIVRGAARTGKSIVAINALGRLLNPKDGSSQKNACYVTANYSPRTYYGDILVNGDMKKSKIKFLFKSPAAFARCSDKDYHCILVDEAHRMFRWKFGLGIGKDVDLIDKIFAASLVNVFFIDQDQAITIDDYLTPELIKDYAAKYGSTVIDDDRLTLTSQFRCIGGEQYLDFVDHFLGFSNALFSLKGIHYKFKVCNSVKELVDIISKRNRGPDKGSRLLAGYTKDHDWVSHKHPEQYDFSYPEEGVYLRWNKIDKKRAALEDVDQADRVFYVNMVQGMELEYAGVIIGKDVTYNEKTGKVEFHHEENAHTDKFSHIRTAPRDIGIRLIRNTYRVLLTRAVKGTYIFAEDPGLEKYLLALSKN